MKSTSKFASAMLLLVSGAAFAAAQTATPSTSKSTTTMQSTTVPATSTTTTTTTGPMTHAQVRAHKKQIAADKKMAMAACKKMKGDEKSACKKDADAKADAAMAELKAKK